MGTTTGRTARLNARISPDVKRRINELRRYAAPAGVSEAAMVETLLLEALAARDARRADR